MNSRELTNLKCEKAKPMEQDYRLPDSHGLFLLVTTTGVKSWRWKYRFDGKQKMMTYGKYPDVSLAEARKLHMDARAQVSQGIDPMAIRKDERLKRQAEKEEGKKASSFTFEVLAKKWFDWWKENKVATNIKMTNRRFDRDIFPAIGQMNPDKIERVDIIRLVQKVDARGAYAVALRELQTINQVFEYGLDLALVTKNPAAGIRASRILKQRPEIHRARVDIQDLPVLLCKIRDFKGNALSRLAMELCALTFVRTSELLHARWEEIDWEQKMWKIPGKRMKMRTEHLVPLAKQTIELLKLLHGLTGNREYMFPHVYGKDGTMCQNTLLEMLYRLGYRKQMTGHGWRGIASTYLRDHKYRRECVERQLAHLSGNDVERAYNSAQYLEERAEMMQFWADALDKMRESGLEKIHLVA